MSTAMDLLAVKGHVVHTIDKTATVFEAISKMVAENVGSLVVLKNENVPCGMITERDYLRKIALKGRSSKTTLVSEIMTENLIHVTPDRDVESCMALMTEQRVRHLPVMSEGELLGIISIGDAVKSIARERTSEIEELTAYVQGRYIVAVHPPLDG